MPCGIERSGWCWTAKAQPGTAKDSWLYAAILGRRVRIRVGG
jgi:hypothetical protein